MADNRHEDDIVHRDEHNFENVFDQVTLEDDIFNPYEKDGSKANIQHVHGQKLNNSREVSEKSQTEKLEDGAYQMDATLLLEDGIYAN